MAQSFIFGGDTGLSYEDLKQRQAFASQMQQRGAQSRPRNAIEGLNSAASSVFGALLAKKLGKEETRQRDEFGNVFQGLIGGQQPQETAYTPFLPEAEAQPAGADAILSGLVQRGLPEHVAQGFVMNFQDESGLNPGINEQNPIVPGSRGGFGLAQWTGPRRVALEKFAAERGTQVGDLNTQLDFLMTELQGPEASAARSILSAGDAGGAAAAIARDFLRPAQEHLDRRVAKYTGGGGAAPSGPDPRIMQAMSNPYATPGQRSVLGALLQQQMQASDPMRQLQMQKAQIELEQMQNPQRERVQDSTGRWRYLDTGEPVFADVQAQTYAQLSPEEVSATPGLDPSKAYQRSPDGKISQIGGGGITINNAQQSSAYGDAPSGTAWVLDAQGEHIMEEGPGGVMRPKTVALGGTQAEERSIDAAERVRAKEAASGSAQQSIALIDSVLNDPGLASVTGMIQGRMPPLTQAGTDLVVKIDQLKGQAFLQAFESLKGGGAITEREGTAAQNAIARLDRAQSEEAYRAALTELREIMARGLARLSGDTSPAQPAGGGEASAAIPDGIDPEDWQFMTPEERALFQ